MDSYDLLFSDKSTFHITGKINRHNVRIWGSEPPHEVREPERDSPKVNVGCGLKHDQVIESLFLAEATLKSDNHLNFFLRTLYSHNWWTCNQR